jgi:hypothetical protein
MMVKSAVTANGVQAILSARPQPSSYIGKAYGPICRPAKKIVKLARFVSETVQYKTGGFVGVEKKAARASSRVRRPSSQNAAGLAIAAGFDFYKEKMPARDWFLGDPRILHRPRAGRFAARRGTRAGSDCLSARSTHPAGTLSRACASGIRRPAPAATEQLPTPVVA